MGNPHWLKGARLKQAINALTARGNLNDPEKLATLKRLKLDKMNVDQLEALEYLSELIWGTGRHAGKAEL